MVLRADGTRGVALLTAMIVLVTLTALGSAFLLTSVSAARLTRQTADLARAAAIAQAGADLALYDLAYGGKTIGDTWAPLDIEGGGTLRITTIRETNAQGGELQQLGIICSEGEYNGVFGTVEVTVWNDAYEIHQLYYKAIYAGNRWGGAYHLEFNGVNHNNQDYVDRVHGDVHVEGDLWLGGDASAHRFGDLSVTGDITMLDMLGNPDHDLGGGGDGSILPPDLAAQRYDAPDRRYHSWDPAFTGEGRDVVSVRDEYDHYSSQGPLLTLEIWQEGGYFSPGGYDEWNGTCTALPDQSTANFFHKGYQNHFSDSFTASDDSRISATENYYIGQRNGGTANSPGDLHGLYGGGHSVITITEEMNNKVYLADGNVWFDSDGDNHLFFVPGPGVDRVSITIIAKGNIYIGDQVFVTTNDVNTEQFANTIGGSTSAQAFRLTDPESGIALIAMRDGESFDDVNKNGKYDAGETILGRDDPLTPLPASQNPSPPGTYPTDYRGRMEGSGNIIFGDTISGPVGVVEAFMFAENNFNDITADTSYANQNPYLFGNMTAGNHVNLNRNVEGWLEQQSWQVNDKPADWTYSRTEPGHYERQLIAGRWRDVWVPERTFFYPPGTDDTNWNDPFVTSRRIYRNGSKWNVQAATHNPLRLQYDARLEDDIVTLPGLPHSTEFHDGAWKVVVWRQYAGRHIG